jgi:hypothetical protein
MNKILTLSAIILALALPATAQTNDTSTNATALIGGPATTLLNFLGTGSNWFAAPYGIVGTDSKFGGGVAVGYKISEFVVPVMRLDYYDSTVWMPSASLQLQAPLTIMGKFTLIPFAFAGLATPIAGKGADNGSAVGIFGAGAAVRISSRFDIVADVEKWSGFKGEQIRAGVLWKF